MAEQVESNGRKKKSAGRPKKTATTARTRLEKKISNLQIKKRKRKELLSLVSSLFCRGYTNAEIRERIEDSFSDTYACLLKGENFWDLLRLAAAEHMFTHTPCNDFELMQRLKDDYPWLSEHVTVAQTVSTDALAERAASKLMDVIRNVRRQKQCKTVHVGFAGGMTLRTVAEKLAQHLNQKHPDNPDTLVFHAMVASFDEDDFYADPNSFITYFIGQNSNVKVRFVRLPLPGIIESARYSELQQMPGIDTVFERRKEIQIIVTSGSLWSDKHSTLRTYLNAALDESQRRSGSENASEEERKQAFQLFKDKHVIGDLLWQPINREGPVQIDMAYRMSILMKLNELPDFIQTGGSILLVIGCSGISRRPKSQLLRTILDLHPKQNWVTDIVTDSPTVEGMYFPQIPNNTWRPPRQPK